MVLLLGTLVRKIEEGLQGVPFRKPLNLLLPTVSEAYQEALLQMALKSVLEKGVDLLSATLMHVDIVLLLRIAHLVVIVTEE